MTSRYNYNNRQPAKSGPPSCSYSINGLMNGDAVKTCSSWLLDAGKQGCLYEEDVYEDSSTSRGRTNSQQSENITTIQTAQSPRPPLQNNIRKPSIKTSVPSTHTNTGHRNGNGNNSGGTTSLTTHTTHSTTPTNNAQTTSDGRIVAPNVGKLSSGSTIEVRLQSIEECVVVLCSVDVLKMRSELFQNILEEQEESTHKVTVQWRDPIVLPETSPFEAAAFLESLHEGRTLFKGEWNLCWARLSVSWKIGDLILEYSSQIDQHVQKLLDYIHRYHWRVNPRVLMGYRIAIFRKGITPLPTIVSGEIIEPSTSIAHSKVRVAFDCSEPEPVSFPTRSNFSPATTPRGTSHHTNATTTNNSNNMTFNHVSSSNSPNTTSSTDSSKYFDLREQKSLVGDIGEPFWVQRDEQSMWSDPDELFLQDAKPVITATDKKIFWEMIRAVVELPQLSNMCNIAIKTTKDVSDLVKGHVTRILWSPDALEGLHIDTMTELIRAAYIPRID